MIKANVVLAHNVYIVKYETKREAYRFDSGAFPGQEETTVTFSNGMTARLDLVSPKDIKNLANSVYKKPARFKILLVEEFDSAESIVDRDDETPS
jgi:hypothetical protein